MKVEHAESFLTVVRCGSLHQAADLLFIAQSTLTHRMKQLETDLGTELFTRHSGGVTLTDTGARFVPIATSIVEQLRTFMQTSQEAKPITIVAGKAFASYELPRLIGGFRRLHPHFRCYVRSTLLPESMQSLLTGTANLAFVGHEMYHPSIEHLSLGDDQIVLITHPHHNFSIRFPGLHAWGEQEVIAFGDSGAPYRKRIEHFFALSGISPNTIMELDSISAVKRMVMQNLGVALLPRRTVVEEVNNGLLVALDIAKGELTRPTWLALLRSSLMDPLLQEFIQWVQSNY
ncbi:LysR family transcriptional regulator [Sulfoacidibacillus ferrooxidans]|uniref:HTH-type transcriptional regulator GltR n=1 Tax=Sulfoacidibacillus ferrooxidans TaxID=2005001 RepID=A0A9X1VBN0_9BACL|nr:LysR family transcriptional regulator [Sulfoacidibacillus ferrooxidans]MCI0183037.1 HTH-type transcriptional regulator GltR [Sulfoacidibacillus ferrooxidans]